MLYFMLFFIYFISGEIDKLNFGQPQHLHCFMLKFRCSTTISPTRSLNYRLIPLYKCLHCGA